MIIKSLFFISLLCCACASSSGKSSSKTGNNKHLGSLYNDLSDIDVRIVYDLSSLLYINVKSGIGHLIKFLDLISTFSAVEHKGIDHLHQLIKLEIIIGYLQSLKVVSDGYILIFDIEDNIIRLVSIDDLIDCIRFKKGYHGGVIVLASKFDFGTTLDLDSLLIPQLFPLKVSSGVSIGELFEYGLSKLDWPIRSYGKSMCLPKIIFVPNDRCKVRYPSDWFHGLGSWLRPNICPICW